MDRFVFLKDDPIFWTEDGVQKSKSEGMQEAFISSPDEQLWRLWSRMVRVMKVKFRIHFRRMFSEFPKFVDKLDFEGEVKQNRE